MEEGLKMNGMTREERIKGAIQEFMANYERRGQRRRRSKTVKLFSVDGEDQRGTQKGNLLTAKGE